MKKIYLILLLFCISATSFAATDTSNLAIHHSVMAGDTVFIKATNPPQMYLRYDFINLGPDTLAGTDTMFLYSPYGVITLLLPAAGIPVGDSVYFLDTIGFTSGPADGPFQWCDSIWAKHNNNTVVYDPNLANNKLCTSVQIKNLVATAVPGNLTASHNGGGQTLDVYPNPATNMVSFDYVFPNMLTDVNVYVTDLVGRRVFQRDLGKMTGSNKVSLDLSSLGSGMYLIEMRAGNVRSVGKLSIQK